MTRSTVSAAVHAPLTRFIGREVELTQLVELLDSGHRLVTLLGVGGIGKTRLALELVRLADPATDEQLVVELAPLTNRELVDVALQEASGAPPVSRCDVLDATIEHIGDRRVLIVLDNCEHLREAAAHVARRLVESCPNVFVMATSRATLGIQGEVIWQVPPLATRRPAGPADGGRPEGEQPDGEHPDAVALFVARAHQARPDFRLDAGNIDAVGRIVEGVDGIPLAIELAAARLRMLEPDEIADGLDDHLRLLSGGPRGADDRHRTMRASLDWSHALLDPELADLFARLSIFAGGWTLDAARTICADDTLTADRILDGLAALVDQSLVVVDQNQNQDQNQVERSGRTRYTMLGFVRQYACERQEADHHADEIALRHRRFYLELAERADRDELALRAKGREALDTEAPNFRDAIAHACRSGHEDALLLVSALTLYWWERGRTAEGIRLTEQALASTAAETTEPRALALAAYSWLLVSRGDFGKVVATAREAITIAQELGRPRAQGRALCQLGLMGTLVDPGSAQGVLQQAVAKAEEANDDLALRKALTFLALNHHLRDDREAMLALADRALSMSDPGGHHTSVRWCLWSMAHASLAAGELDEARRTAERAYVALSGLDPVGRDCAAEVLSIIDALTGDPDRARQRAEAALPASLREAVRLGTGALMHALGVAALAADDLPAARDWGTRMYEREQAGAVYIAWHGQEILMHAAAAEGDATATREHGTLLAEIAERLGNPRALAIAHRGLARARLADGDHAGAEALAHSALGAAAEHGWRLEAIATLDVIAAIAAQTNRPGQAARLLAAAVGLRESIGVCRVPPEAEFWTAQHAGIEDALGSAAYQQARNEGAGLSLADAVAYARRGRGSRPRCTHGWEALTQIERQVAELAARGLSNPDIAEALFISRSTVKTHLSHVYVKLDVANRTELATAAARR